MKTTFGIEMVQEQHEMFLPDEYGYDMWLVNAGPDEIAYDLVKRGLIKPDLDKVYLAADRLWDRQDDGHVMAELALHLYAYAKSKGIDLRDEILKAYEMKTEGYDD